jgi:hypothetical protein
MRSSRQHAVIIVTQILDPDDPSSDYGWAG